MKHEEGRERQEKKTKRNRLERENIVKKVDFMKPGEPQRQPETKTAGQ